MKYLWFAAVLCVFCAGCGTVSSRIEREEALKIYLQGLLYEGEGDFASAQEFYTRSLRIGGASSHLSLKLGETALKEKRYSDALQWFSKAYAENPDASAAFGMGLSHFFLKSNSEAMHFLSEGLSKQENITYRAILSDLFIEAKQYNDAKKSYEILLEETRRRNFLILFNYGALLEKLKLDAEAEEAYRESLRLAPTFLRTYLSLASLSEKKGDRESAERYYLTALRINPKERSLYGLLAWLYIQQKRLEDGLAITKKGIAETGESAELYAISGLIYLEKEEYLSAREDLQKAISLKEHAGSFFHLGIAYDKLGEPEESEQCMRKAIELDPSYHPAMNYLGYTFLLANVHLQEAFSLIERANILDPDNPAYLDSLGWAWFLKGDDRRAEHYLLKAVEKDRDPEIMEHLGHLYYRKKDMVKAVYWWAASLELKKNPDLEKLLKTAQETMRMRK